jgi:uncharacterized membrane protein
MELIIVMAVLWIVVLPIATLMLLFSASSLFRRRARQASAELAPVVPLRPASGSRRRHVA